MYVLPSGLTKEYDGDLTEATYRGTYGSYSLEDNVWRILERTTGYTDFEDDSVVPLKDTYANGYGDRKTKFYHVHLTELKRLSL